MALAQTYEPRDSLLRATNGKARGDWSVKRKAKRTRLSAQLVATDKNLTSVTETRVYITAHGAHAYINGVRLPVKPLEIKGIRIPNAWSTTA